MSLKDKLEIGLKPDAPYRKDNLPEGQEDDQACKDASVPGDSAEARDARDDCDHHEPSPVTKSVDKVTGRR